MSQSLPNQVNDFNYCKRSTETGSPSSRNPFQTRSTTSMGIAEARIHPRGECRNPFQTRSTTSIHQPVDEPFGGLPVAIPSKPGQRLQYRRSSVSRGTSKPSQSLPNQVNDFNSFIAIWAVERGEECRNPFQTRSTTSI